MHKKKLSLQSSFKTSIETTNYLINWSESHRYIYIENPKVACTTIKKILYNSELNSNYFLNNEGDVHDVEKKPLISPLSNVDRFNNALNNPNVFKFCFVRNPFTRILSCWLDKFVKNEYECSRLAPLLGFKANYKPSFKDFLLAVAEQKDYERDIHWSSQEFLLSPDAMRYSYIGRFESLKNNLSLVSEVLNIKDFLILEGTRHATNSSSFISEYYSDDEIKIVQSIYELDFLRFGYGFDTVFIRK